MNLRVFLFIIMLFNAILNATPLVKGNANMLIVEGLQSMVIVWKLFQQTAVMRLRSEHGLGIGKDNTFTRN